MCTRIIAAVLATLCLASEVYAAEVDHVLVIKSERKLFLMSGDSIVRQYDIALGANPTGHKSQEGDEKTPEGLYELDYKKSDSSFYKAIHISYPNADDLAAAKEAGVDPGGLIMIHGQRNGFGWLAPVSQNFDWTNGCIAVTNSEMDEVWNLVSVGTTIEIRP